MDRAFRPLSLVPPPITAEHKLRLMLDLFPDRTTYEQWLTARKVDDAHRAHLEQFLPARLQAQEAV